MIHATIIAAMLSSPLADITPRVVSTGAAIVAAEARGESFAEQVAVAAVIANRVADRRPWRRCKRQRNPWLGVMHARRQFARPAPRDAVTAAHRIAFIIGAVVRPGWTSDALMFATHDAVERLSLVKRWGEGGFVPIDDTGTAHVFFMETES